jgi:hypothetical protein
MWFIGVTICIFNNKFLNFSFKNSLIWKNGNGFKGCQDKMNNLITLSKLEQVDLK